MDSEIKGLRTDWHALKVAPTASARQAMKVIDGSRLGIALVVDDAGRMVGTVTDGDLRRAILRDLSLDVPVREIMTRHFVALPDGSTAAAARSLMQGGHIKVLPVLDKDRILHGYYSWKELFGPQPKANWVVVMAGGEGRRLRPLTDDIPKPMLPVAGQPILETSVRRLVGEGFQRLFISVNYRSEQIEQHFGDGSAFGCQITYVREDRPLGTGGALSLLPEKPTAPFFVVNGDLVTDVNFSAVLDYHVTQGGIASLCVREFTQAVPYGVIRCEGDSVVAMEEKPVNRHLINAGIYVLEPRILAMLEPGEACGLPEILARGMNSGEKVHAFLVHERWVDIGLPTDYERVRNGLE